MDAREPLPTGKEGAERILVVATKYIGDTVLAIPFLRNLRRAFPNAAIEVCAEGPARQVLAECPYVDHFVSWQRPQKKSLAASLAALQSQAAWLAGRRYDRVYLLKRSLSAGLLALLAGIPERIGLAGDGSFFHTKSVGVVRGRHQADRYLDLLRADDIAVDDGHAENWSSLDARAHVDSLLARMQPERPKVFVAIKSTDANKHWPLDRWAAVLEWLVERRGCDIVLCGSPRDQTEHDALREALPAETSRHVHDFSSDLSLRETGALLARMTACVGVDTGLVHLAASYGVPVVVMFGPTDPNQWSPWSPRAAVLRGTTLVSRLRDRLANWRAVRAPAWPFGKASMEDIPVEDVVDAIAAFLPETTPAVVPSVPATPLRTLDLREGSFRYEVVANDANTHSNFPGGNTQSLGNNEPLEHVETPLHR